ncbi:uncharacterized protein K460DRAFT_329668 [Cucurbitaria berberidis CBS 394.84]|uniref:Uncharacterized protein n=1 Tax=Cucurbitaria berberidis CBS 394.84 TaxID=1168544 RepID=A0A9P4L981_9PLEO|nr:uncharacterized protein K460DRAFT_329668 [Cucurbitaria berberidis CBS 394.84]KAF1846891.1 hypothetical protein K460DRAFT_329668 [Cucurbitaria berberidis CBS 394.84]
MRGGGNCCTKESEPAVEIRPPVAPRSASRVIPLDVIIQKANMSEDTLSQGLEKIHAALENQGAMGMGNRSTADFDILVEDGEARKARRTLLRHEEFGKTSLNSLYVKIGNKFYNVDIVTPSRTHLSSFPTSVYTQHTTFAVIAPLDSMIETKIGAYRDLERKSSKRSTDESDIAFLLELAASKGMTFGFDGVPGLDKDFSASFRRTRRESEKSLDSLGCSLE